MRLPTPISAVLVFAAAGGLAATISVVSLRSQARRQPDAGALLRTPSPQPSPPSGTPAPAGGTLAPGPGAPSLDDPFADLCVLTRQLIGEAGESDRLCDRLARARDLFGAADRGGELEEIHGYVRELRSHHHPVPAREARLAQAAQDLPLAPLRPEDTGD